MKKCAVLFGVAALCATLYIPAMADVGSDEAFPAERPMHSQYQIAVDGTVLNPVANVLVPVRALAESLDWTVAWLGDGEIYLDSKNYHTIITVGEPDYEVESFVMDYVKTNQEYTFEIAPVLIDGVTYAPLSLFQAMMGNGEDVITVEDGVIEIHTDRVIPSQPKEYESLEALCEAVGFTFPLPELGEGYEVDSYFVVNDILAEVNWTSEHGDISYRVSPGEDFNSGVFLFYPTTEFEVIKEVEVVVRGIGSQVQIAEWVDDGMAYSLFFHQGMHAVDMRDLVTGILAGPGSE